MVQVTLVLLLFFSFYLYSPRGLPYNAVLYHLTMCKLHHFPSAKSVSTAVLRRHMLRMRQRAYGKAKHYAKIAHFMLTQHPILRQFQIATKQNIPG